MRVKAFLAALGLGFTVVLIWAGLLWRGPGPIPMGPQSITLAYDLPEVGPLQVTVFGTSLSSPRYDWPETLQQSLVDCLGRSVRLTRVTEPGANVDWAAAQLGAVAASAPDVILVEFAINDADLRDGVVLARARARLTALVADLRADRPEASVVLLTMNPAHGLRGVLRPRLSAHYDAVRQVARATEAGLVDLEAQWRARARDERGLAQDGLHPDPGLAREVIVPVLLTYLGCPG